MIGYTRACTKSENIVIAHNSLYTTTLVLQSHIPNMIGYTQTEYEVRKYCYCT